jgi:adenine-specific DNA-methyltransferase
MSSVAAQYDLFEGVAVPATDPCAERCVERARLFPQLRFMGSKFRLLPWLHEAFHGIEFQSAIDAFSGSGSVAYLLKAMGKRVIANDFLNFSATIGKAIIENPGITLDDASVSRLSRRPRHSRDFIRRTFGGIFYTADDLRFLDEVWENIRRLRAPYRRAIALAALTRSCVKRQPRGVFTVSGDPDHYKDGRRDLRLSLEEHFIEQVAAYNRCVFSNGRVNRALRGDVFAVDPEGIDLVYMDPPYVPRSDDNCYIKRYHFLEGLSCYWEGQPILETSRVKKIAKRYTPFSYRRDSLTAFDRLFAHFRNSVLVLSYSSNGYPDLDVLVELMGRYKQRIGVRERDHRYHFGTHDRVRRSVVKEYLVIGQ